jgi:hypothetical protein
MPSLPVDCQGGDKVGIGGSIFLIVVGAIFAFALDVNLGWLDLNIVGYVLMLAGLAGLGLTLWFWNSRRRPTTVVQQRPAPPSVPQQPVAPHDAQVVEEYREVRRSDNGY